MRFSQSPPPPVLPTITRLLPTITRHRRRATALIAAGSLLLSACVSDDENSTSEHPVDLDSSSVSLTAGLEASSNCDDLLERLIDEGLERVGPYGFGLPGGWFRGGPESDGIDMMADDMMESDSEESLDVAVVSGDEVGNDFSGTNNQEVGVDEPDLVKTDGDRLVVVNGNRVSVIDTTGSVPELANQIRLPQDTFASELFLVGDTAYVMSQGWRDEGFGPASSLRHDGSSTTQIIEIDLAEGDVVRTLEFEGSYLSAREIDGTLRFVLWGDMMNFPFVYPSSSSAEDGALDANRTIIENSTIDQWLPSYRLIEGNEGDELSSGRLVDCDRLYLPGAFSGFGSLTVLTVDTQDGLEPMDALGVVTEGQTIYASTERLTVATARWPEFDDDGQILSDEGFNTQLHSFDITEPTTGYVGSGSVSGHLLDQYSLSQHNGHLRVATTAGDPWSAGATQSESFVTVLAERDGQLQQVGKVGGIGVGETIFAVRYQGDTAYVVTFRQTDPFYVIDLSDPTNPTVAGELKIPGFSAYLHPIGEDLVVGIGQDATDEGMTTGAQLSIFDVSEPTNPTRIGQHSFGSDSQSRVDWDARAFTWWPTERLAFVPVSSWDFDETTNSESHSSESVLVAIAPDGSIDERGRIGHPASSECESWFDDEPFVDDVEEPAVDSDDSTIVGDEVAPPAADAEASFTQAESRPADQEWCWSYQPDISRTVVIGDVVYTISDQGVMATDLETLDELEWINLAP